GQIFGSARLLRSPLYRRISLDVSAIACTSDSVDKLIGCRFRLYPCNGRFGREVYRCCYTGKPVERFFDARGARRARHAFDRQLDASPSRYSLRRSIRNGGAVHGSTMYTLGRYGSRYPIRVYRSQTDLTHQDIPEHDPVAEQAIPWMAKCCGTVVLEKEVADPRERIARDRRREEPPGVSRRRRNCNERERERRTREVESAAPTIVMLGQVKRIELRERGIAILHARPHASHSERNILAVGAAPFKPGVCRSKMEAWGRWDAAISMPRFYSLAAVRGKEAVQKIGVECLSPVGSVYRHARDRLRCQRLCPVVGLGPPDHIVSTPGYRGALKLIEADASDSARYGGTHSEANMSGWVPREPTHQFCPLTQ